MHSGQTYQCIFREFLGLSGWEVLASIVVKVVIFYSLDVPGILLVVAVVVVVVIVLVVVLEVVFVVGVVVVVVIVVGFEV